MSKQVFVADTILTASEMNTLQGNDYNQTVSTKTASYTLVAADVGTRIAMNSASATTITVNTSLFSAGDTLFIGPNLGVGVCTITAGTATVSTSGSLALAQYGGGTLYFTSAGVAIFFSGGITQNAITVDFLVLSAGAGGGGDGGGGGGGGLRSTVTATGGGGTLESAQSLFTNNDYPVIVGAGGTAGTYNGSTATARATSGGISQFNTIVSAGGGAGAGFSQFGTQDGGSGGAQAVTTNGAIGVGTTNQGYAGGTGGTTAGGQGYGGGGGAGAVGGNGASATGGAGGVGVASSITGSSVTYSGGGGGGVNTAGTGGTGGSSNGGNGSATGNGTAGTVNRGGGGGGGGGNNPGNGGAGSSGIVILRYADTLTITFGVGVTGTESAASGGYKRATITAGSGSVKWS